MIMLCARQAALADAGYASEANFAALEARQLSACVVLGREGEPAGPTDPTAHRAARPLAGRMATAADNEQHRHYKFSPDPTSGWTKEATGFRRSSVRGLEAVTRERHLVSLA